MHIIRENTTGMQGAIVRTLLQIPVQQNYNHASDLRILTMNLDVLIFLSPPCHLWNVTSWSCHLLFSHWIRLSETQGSFHGGEGVLVMKLTIWKVINFPDSLTFHLTCLINTADCFLNDSFKFWEGKSLPSVHRHVAHAHRANLAYHNEYFRLLSS